MSTATVRERILVAIKQRFPQLTQKQRAERLRISLRQYRRWETEYVPEVLERLAESGIIHINDAPCSCQPATSEAA